MRDCNRGRGDTQAYFLVLDIYICICYNACVPFYLPRERHEETPMPSLEERGDKPQNRTNARSKHSPANIRTDRPPVTKTTSNHKRANPVAWFTTMAVMLGYGMYQHDNTVLFSVMILVTVGCGYGHAVEVLFKYLKLKAPSD